MAKNFLKRFERLENVTDTDLVKQGFMISKRFEKLEICDKKIEISITDKIAEAETAPSDASYYFICPYCGMENPSGALNCNFCKRNIKADSEEEGRTKEGLVKVKICSNCGSKNLLDRKTCWFCSKALFSGKPGETRINTENVIVLNIDGTQYKSSDQNLPTDIILLMDKIRKEGYKKEIVDQWLKERNQERSEKRQDLETRLSSVRAGLVWRIILLVIFLGFILFQFRACLAAFSNL